MEISCAADQDPTSRGCLGDSRRSPEREYRAEARELLEDDFLYFSCSDIAQVFEQNGNSYVPAWHKLYDADVNGNKAEIPISVLGTPRTASKGAQGQSVKSRRLQVEVRGVRNWQEREQREYKAWADGLFFSEDPDGKEQLLDADGMQIMMEWERPLMERCVDELGIKPGSSVLEIGFGCGYSSSQIQRANPKLHTIIECSEPVLERLRLWAAERPNVKVVEGTWQERLPELGIFDHIFFDDYGTPGRADREMEDACPDDRYQKEYIQSSTHFHGFLNIALRWHSHKDTRITGYLEHPIEMERDDVDASFQTMRVQPPAHCHYWPGELTNQATVPLFVKDQPSAEESGESTRAGSSASSRSRSRSRARE